MTVNLLGVLEEATYTVRREGERVVFSPAPPPEHRPTLTAWKHALPHALEEGKRIPARELLRLERLTCILLAREGVPEPVWATFYYPAQKEPERVLAPVENLFPHLLWRARNLPAPRRVHLGSTDGRMVLDLEAPLVIFLRVERSGRVEIYGWPDARMRVYTEAAARGRMNPNHILLERQGKSVHGSYWTDIL
ncbi:hypothetical protein [Thermus sp. FJN-A]